MKGFNTSDGYMGLVGGKYILFASEDDYYEYMNDQEIILEKIMSVFVTEFEEYRGLSLRSAGVFLVRSLLYLGYNEACFREKKGGTDNEK